MAEESGRDTTTTIRIVVALDRTATRARRR